MKKIIAVVFVSLMLLVATNAVNAQQYGVLVSTSAQQFNNAPSTSSAIGMLIPRTVVRAKIAKITITWNVAPTTGSIRLYDCMNDGNTATAYNSKREIYSVFLPSASNNATSVNMNGSLVIQETYEASLPKVALRGLQAVHESGTSKSPIVQIEYW